MPRYHRWSWLEKEELTIIRQERLKREGRWDAFVAERKRLEAEGKTKLECYWMAAEKFRAEEASSVPMSPDTEAETASVSRETRMGGDVLRGRAKAHDWEIRAEWYTAKASNPLQDILWVANHLGLDEVDLKDAPSPAAAYMLKRCKTNAGFEESFWADFYVKVVPGRAAVEEAFKQGVDDGLERIERNDEIQAISEKFRGEEKAGIVEAIGHAM